jgi:hypothetical protein
MSLYQLHAALYRYLNPRDAEPLPLERQAVLQRYELDEREVQALLAADVAELYRLGVHPVLLNSYARARLAPAEYRAVLARLRESEREREA